jgi:hypothetical protein
MRYSSIVLDLFSISVVEFDSILSIFELFSKSYEVINFKINISKGLNP